MVNNLPSVSEMLKNLNLSAKKKFGQHFLFDMNITDKIVKFIPNIDKVNVIEIGPGPAGLTRSLLNSKIKSLIAVERDSDMIPILEQVKSYYGDKFSYINEDALKLDKSFYDSVKSPKVICSNLPYNVGTELLIGWLHNICEFDSLVLMFQKEVAERIIAKENDEQYGRLAVLVGAVANVEKLFDLSPSCFVPAPKVWSSVVLIRPKENPLSFDKLKKLEALSAKLFSVRRKMIRAILKNVDDLEYKLNICNINMTDRPENISVEKMIKLSEIL